MKQVKIYLKDIVNNCEIVVTLEAKSIRVKPDVVEIYGSEPNCVKFYYNWTDIKIA